MNLFEPFHVTNGVRQGRVLSPYLFAVYLDDLSLELNNIKAGCYMGEVLFEPFDVCWWYLCVLSKCTRVAKYARCVSGLCKCHEIVFNCSNTVYITSKAKTAKSTVIQLLALGVLTVKGVSHHKYLGIVLDIELSDDKDIQRQLRYQYYAVMRTSFFRCSNAVKNVRFRSFYSSIYAS